MHYTVRTGIDEFLSLQFIHSILTLRIKSELLKNRIGSFKSTLSNNPCIAAKIKMKVRKYFKLDDKNCIRNLVMQSHWCLSLLMLLIEED